MKNRSKTDHPSRKALLVVDNEKSIVDLATELFTTLGYKVVAAYDDGQALSMLEKQSVDLLICNVVTPNLNGWQLAALVRKFYPHINIQVISGFSDETPTDMKDGDLYQNLLYKPYTSNSLRDRIQNLMTTSKTINQDYDPNSTLTEQPRVTNIENLRKYFTSKKHPHTLIEQ